MKNNWFSITISFIALFVAIMAICCSVDEDVIINDQSIVLIFVGILATFIVVSNYSQVRDIKEDFTKKIKELNYNNENIKQTIFLLLKENAFYEIAQNIKNENFQSLKWLKENRDLVDIIDKNKYNSLPPDSFILFQNNGKSKIFSKNEMNNYMKIFDSLKENKEN